MALYQMLYIIIIILDMKIILKFNLTRTIFQRMVWKVGVSL